MKTHVIGCGGVASYFLPSFFKTIRHAKEPYLRNHPIVLVDGDTLEQKNLIRQQFSEGHVGKPKVEALAEQYAPEYDNLEIYGRYITDTYTVDQGSCLFCFVDNHPARKDVLAIADRTQSTVIIGANAPGCIDAHAYIYLPEWKDSAYDPRVRYPAILTAKEGSPVHATGCATEEHIAEEPQTPMANMQAAAQAAALWNFWFIDRHGFNEEASGSVWPIEFSNITTKQRTITMGEALNPG